MKIIYYLSVLCIAANLDATTLVYNMRIRRVFRISEFLKQEPRSSYIATALPIFYQRKRHIVDDRIALDVCEKTRMGGSLLNFHYRNKHDWWLDLTTGIEYEHARINGSSTVNASRTGCDDLVFAGGVNLFPVRDTQLVFYGIGGIPTRLKVEPQEAQNTLVGTRFFSLGFGSEFSYEWFFELKRALISVVQVRFLHLFNRSWTPILPEGSTIQPGNVTDLLLTMHYREKKDIFELGYNPTFFTNQSVTLPTKKLE